MRRVKRFCCLKGFLSFNSLIFIKVQHIFLRLKLQRSGHSWRHYIYSASMRYGEIYPFRNIDFYLGIALLLNLGFTDFAHL